MNVSPHASRPASFSPQPNQAKVKSNTSAPHWNSKKLFLLFPRRVKISKVSLGIADIPCDIHICSNFPNFQMANQEGIQFE